MPAYMSSPSICPLCGEDRVLLVSESWAGSCHAACSHGACGPCLRGWIGRQIPQCAAEGQLRVRCYMPHCRKVLPQTLLFHAFPGAFASFSEQAQEKFSLIAPELGKMVGEKAWKLVLEHSFLRNRAAHWGFSMIHSEETSFCTRCTSECAALLLNPPCGHYACAACWAHHAEAQLGSFRSEQPRRMQCIGPGCHDAIQDPLLDGVLGCYSELVSCQIPKIYTPGVQLRCFQVCTVCRDCPVVLVNCQCAHAACEGCWLRWIESQISHPLKRCALLRSLPAESPMRCLGPSCQSAMEPALWRHLCDGSLTFQDFEQQALHRKRLESSDLYPKDMQVECPHLDCYGLGYLGFDTAMCFVCEYQWVLADPGSVPSDTNVEEVLGIKVKKCPRCHEYIEKDGGCDHMSCRCKHEFYWSTLKAYHPQ